MNARKAESRSRRSSNTLYRVAEGAELVLSDAETLVLIVRGACCVKSAGKLERLEAGALVLRRNRATRMDPCVARALALLQSAPAKRWTVARLARAVGVSRAALARRFAAASGQSPMRYLAELRLGLAAAMLDAEDAGLAEIAARVGYASEFAFSRAFKRRHGIAPGSFRRLRSAPPTLALAA